ncbi:transcription elongation factor GreA [Petroclostridium sp. X23]|uniref:transcription elongation factor GreA n=1 Tax=Petroclostridium sp. X23 TaxID=3045146 RepID=UPI0024ADF8B4|nr:transcription elongation factor GreA [Petroclostridium sp. X23]WHH56867.1 transcription elongation factor GreA [Petroclostridium sp. X23]
MSSSKQIVLTVEGLEKLESELEYLKTVKRKDVAEKIKQAIAFGDLSENSEYDEAKNEQAQMEVRIVQLENMLKNAKVIDEEDINTDIVSIGSKVTVLDLEFDEKIEYAIVGSTEADPSNYKISDESPVGSALIGQKVGNTVDVAVPDGVIKFKVLSISK